MYEHGRGVKKDEVEAVTWYRLAAGQSYANAQYAMGTMYENGRGVEKNVAEAMKWYDLAAAQNQAMAKTAIERLTPADEWTAQASWWER